MFKDYLCVYFKKKKKIKEKFRDLNFEKDQRSAKEIGGEKTKRK